MAHTPLWGSPGILSAMSSIRGALGATPDSGAFELRSSAVRTPAASRLRAGSLGIFGLLACGLLISLAAANTDSLLPESARPVPAWLGGPFAGAGIGLGVVPLIAVLSAMFASYVLVVRAGEQLSARLVLMTIAALHALILLAPPLLSTDVFSYQAYGRMGALYGANPYLQGPHAIALDPVYPFIGAKWVTMPTAYGPLFTIFSYVLAPLSLAASVLAYKAVAAVSSLVLVAFVWNSARLRGLDPVRAAALVGLNPLIVLYAVGGAHNDLLMLALLAAGIYLVLAHRDRAAGWSMVAAAGIKLTAGLVFAFALADGGGRSSQRRRDFLSGAAVAAGVLAVPTLAVFGVGPLHMLLTLQKGQSEGDWHSIPGFISTKLGLITAGHVVSVLLALAFVAAFLWLLRRVRRGALDWIAGAGWATVALLLTASALLPWYVAWLMPLAALAGDRRLWRTAIVMSGVVQAIQVLGYIPHYSLT